MKCVEREISMPVAAGVQIYKGAIVNLNAAGYLKPAGDVAGEVCAGIADKNIDNTGGVDGAFECPVLKGVAGLRADGVAPVQAGLGRPVYAQDDGNITDAATAANDVIVGHLDSIDGSTFWVKLFDQA